MSRGVGVGSLVLAGAAFAVGLVLGGLGPRAELRQAQDEVFELRRKGMDRGRVRNELVDLVANGFGRPEPAARPAKPTPPPVLEAERQGVAPAEEEEEDDDNGVKVEWNFDDGEEMPEDPVGAAREMMELRRAQARAALFEDIEPTPAQEAEIDRAINGMNTRLIGLAEEVVAEVKAGDHDSQRRVFMEIAAEGLDIVMEAEDTMLASLTPDQAAAVREEATDPMSFVDPALVDVLAELEGLVEP